MMNMPNFGLETSQPGSGEFNMDDFADYAYEPGQFLDQHLPSSYANSSQHNQSIRPSDLDANAFNDMGVFGVSHATEMPLQIDPILTESKGMLGHQMLAPQPLTPPTSLSPERFDAVHSRLTSFTGAAGPGKSVNHKRKSAEFDVGDADAERRLKNRVAASKCRVKKKGREQMLIQESDQKEHENLKLRAEHRRLTQEALWYKNQLILHGNCGDPRINQWLTNSAAKIVHDFGEGPALQPDAPSNTAVRPSAENVYERRDSGISTNSKPDLKVAPGSSPLAGRPVSVRIGLGSPVDEASPQDVRISPIQLKSEPDVDLTGGEPMRRARSLDHSTLDALATAATDRAKSVPLHNVDVVDRLGPVHGDSIHQYPSGKGEMSSVSPSMSLSTAPPGVVDSTPAVPWTADLSATAMTIDPRLRGGDMSLNPVHADGGYLAMPVQQVEQSQNELLQIPGTKWMEA